MMRSALITALILSALFSLFWELTFFSKWRRKKEIAKRTFIDAESLRGKKILISERIYELNQRGRKIDAILDKIRENDSRQLQNVRAKLLDARQIVISQYARYELQKQKIELIRLQNVASPYLYRLHRLNEFETEEGLTAVEQTLSEMEKIRRNLTRYDAIEFPAGVLPEKQNFLAQLTETETSCEKLREVILSRQAAQALRDVSPLKDNLKLPNSKEFTHAVDTFNIQTTLTDFSESFDELERDYKRLKAEEEISQKFLKE